MIISGFFAYLKNVLTYIAKNKGYALFYVVSTALIFVFVTILLQISFSITHNVAPYIYSDRTVVIYDFCDKKGNDIGGINYDEQNLFEKTLKNVEAVARYNAQAGNVFIGNAVFLSTATFVNTAYWDVNKFTFLYGRPFTEEEARDKKKVCVVKKDIAEKYIGNTNAVGKHITFQNTEYEIIGVVDNYVGIYTNDLSSIWIPDCFNKFFADMRRYYTIHILFNENISANEMKNNTANAVMQYFKNKNIDADISSNNIYTLEEYKIKNLGGDKIILAGGTAFLIFILLIIPILNIVTLNMANTENRSTEVAIRRALGADRLSVFSLLMSENIILSLIGLLIGILSVFPTIYILENMFLDFPVFGKVSILNEISFTVILLYLIPLNILFAFMAGGIPAYRISKLNLANSLKGGSR